MMQEITGIEVCLDCGLPDIAIKMANKNKPIMNLNLGNKPLLLTPQNGLLYELSPNQDA